MIFIMAQGYGATTRVRPEIEKGTVTSHTRLLILFDFSKHKKRTIENLSSVLTKYKKSRIKRMLKNTQ
jgi:hypothetical protein